MQIEAIDALIAQVEEQFNALNLENNTLKDRLNAIDTQLKQLQGKHEGLQKVKELLTADQPDNDPAALTPDPFKPKENPEKEVKHAAK